MVERLSLELVEPASAVGLACERLAERLLVSDPTTEAAHRALMRVHALRGHQNAALRQFELCRALLKKHLLAEPEAQTALLATSVGLCRTEDSRAYAVTKSHSISVLARHNGRPSVAVLPFQNLSGDAEQEYFADGIVEDITVALARFRHLYVIAQSELYLQRPDR